MTPSTGPHGGPDGRPPVPAAPPPDGLDSPNRALLDAFATISSDLDTGSVLVRIVEAACALTGAECGVLGVIGHDGRFSELIAPGIAVAEAQRLATEPRPHEDEGPFPRPEVRIPIKVRGTPFGVLTLVARPDRPFGEQEALLGRSLVSVAGFVIDNARAYGVSERRRRWLEMFGELSELMLPPITLPEALGRIATAVRRASGARSSSVVQVPEQGTPFAAATAGPVPDLSEDEQRGFDDAVRTVVASGEVTTLCLRQDLVAVLAPLRAHLTIPGVIVLAHPRRDGTDELEERELLSSFADQAALALDRTQALEDREEMAVVSDRDRIARDLHDVVIQRLFAAGLHMQSIRSAATTPELKERIDESVRDLDQTIRDIRTTIFELQTRPQNSIRSEVGTVVREYIPVLGFAPSVQMHGPVDASIDPRVRQQFAAVLREALSNIAMHAQAGSASVEVRVSDTHLRLRVTDNGRGIPEVRKERGLRNVRRRALMLGGRLDVWPHDPSGTAFIWSVPLEQG